MSPSRRGERELGEIVDASVLPHGGMSVFHYVASTPMSEPSRCVPSQVLSEREIRSGDIVTVEISAAHFGYAGQGLRTYVVDAEPNQLFRELHDCAEGVFSTLGRNVVPGAGNESWTFRENQTIVVQPNIVTLDESAGVQTGELCRVTEDGSESLHDFPLELIQT